MPLTTETVAYPVVTAFPVPSVVVAVTLPLVSVNWTVPGGRGVAAKLAVWSVSTLFKVALGAVNWKPLSDGVIV